MKIRYSGILAILLFPLSMLAQSRPVLLLRQSQNLEQQQPSSTVASWESGGRIRTLPRSSNSATTRSGSLIRPSTTTS